MLRSFASDLLKLRVLQSNHTGKPRFALGQQQLPNGRPCFRVKDTRLMRVLALAKTYQGTPPGPTTAMMRNERTVNGATDEPLRAKDKLPSPDHLSGQIAAMPDHLSGQTAFLLAPAEIDQPDMVDEAKSMAQMSRGMLSTNLPPTTKPRMQCTSRAWYCGQ